MNRNITALILIVLAIGLYFTYTKGEIDVVKSIQAQNDQYISALDNAAQLIKFRDKVRTDYNNLSQDDKDRIAKMIPSTVDNIRLVIELNNIALQHNIPIKNVKASVSGDSKSKQSASTAFQSQSASLQNSISNPTVDTVDVSFSATASYADFTAFLQDLESNLRIMDVTHLTLSANNTDKYDYSVELKTYWLRQ
ncbi:MAG: hypothetical protein WCG07_02000 [Candidatus Taylorbacteria bacterium]